MGGNRADLCLCLKLNFSQSITRLSDSFVLPQDVQGYKWVCWRMWLCRLTAVLSLGLILIVFHWRPRLAVLARCNSCPLGLADVLLITVKIIPIHMLGLFERFSLFKWIKLFFIAISATLRYYSFN